MVIFVAKGYDGKYGVQTMNIYYQNASKVEELKISMKDMVAANMGQDSNSDPMSNLNDL